MSAVAVGLGIVPVDPNGAIEGCSRLFVAVAQHKNVAAIKVCFDELGIYLQRLVEGSQGIIEAFQREQYVAMVELAVSLARVELHCFSKQRFGIEKVAPLSIENCQHGQNVKLLTVDF